MREESRILIKRLEELRNEAVSFMNQYEVDVKDPDIDFIANEVNRMKRVVLAHTEMRNVIEQKEKALSVLCNYLNEDYFNSDQEGLVALLQPTTR